MDVAADGARANVPLLHFPGHDAARRGCLSKRVCAELRNVYGAPTEQAGFAALDAFEAKYAQRFPSVALSWRSNWARVRPFFDFPPDLRKLIYTTNASMQELSKRGCPRLLDSRLEQSLLGVTYAYVGRQRVRASAARAKC